MLCSLYRVEQHYGGPEEGGWWYETRTFVKVVFRGGKKQYTAPKGRRVVLLGWKWRGKQHPTRTVRETAAHRNGWDGHDGHALFMWERRKGQWDNSRRPRPHYE